MFFQFECLSKHCNNQVRCDDGGNCCNEVNTSHCDLFVCNTDVYQRVEDCGTAVEQNQFCIADYHCEAGDCVPDLDNGSFCDEPSDCASDNCNNDTCCPAGGTCCTGPEVCAQEQPICGAEFQCVDCNVEDLCENQYRLTPICDTSSGRCVECLTNEHCLLEMDTDSETDIDTDTELPLPFKSPLGACTPDHVCTCWVDHDTWQCTTSADCDSGYLCAQDFIGGFHATCLRSCSTAQTPFNGVACEERDIAEPGSRLVWVPVTTCYAFNRFGIDSSAGEEICSVDGPDGLEDGFGHMFDGQNCCTYSCNSELDTDDDNWSRVQDLWKRFQALRALAPDYLTL